MSSTRNDDQQSQQRTQGDVGNDGRSATERVRHHPRGQMFDATRMRRLGRTLGEQMRSQTSKRPYAMLGAAAAIGFVAGSLFGTRLGQIAIAAGIGYAARNILEGEMGEPLRQGFEKLAQERG